jgi:predicted HTH domain antitoxin
MDNNTEDLAVILNLIEKDKMTVSQGAKRLKMPIQRLIQLVYDAGIDLSDTDEEWEANRMALQKIFPDKQRRSLINDCCL